VFADGDTHHHFFFTELELDTLVASSPRILWFSSPHSSFAVFSSLPSSLILLLSSLPFIFDICLCFYTQESK
jgi:hypothetical protein